MQSTDFPFAIFWLLLSIFSSIPLLLLGARIPPRLLRFVLIGRWLLIPYLGLLTGAISPRLMGLSGANWVTSLGLGLVFVFAAFVLLTLVRATLTAHHSNSESSQPVRRMQWEPVQPNIHRIDWTTYGWILILAGCTEFHWAFLRAAVQETLIVLAVGDVAALYVAIWGAALLAAPDVLLRASKALSRIVQTSTLAATSILFFYTQNFWLCWILHASMQFLLNEEAGADHHRKDHE